MALLTRAATGLVAGLTALAALSTTSTLSPSLSQAPVERAVATLGAVAFRGEVDALTRVGEYAYLQLNAWEVERAAALKAAHPGLRVLVYKDVSSTRSYAVRDGRDDALLPAGVGWARADAEHPEWFLRDADGGRLEWPFAGHWWMDVADAGYQAAWLASVSAELARGPWDGVVLDNVLASPHAYLGERTLPEHPTLASFRAATEGFLRAVAPALRAQGHLVIGNVSDAPPALWDRWTGLLSGGNAEHSFAWSDGTRHGGAQWLERIEQVERTQAAGRIHTATTSVRSGDLATLTYVRASWLLAWDGGRSGAAQMVALSDREDPWDDVVATDLGDPLSPRRLVDGTWQRAFTGGLSVVNPGEQTVVVELPRTLRDGDGRRTDRVVLAGRTAALLRG